MKWVCMAAVLGLAAMAADFLGYGPQIECPDEPVGFIQSITHQEGHFSSILTNGQTVYAVDALVTAALGAPVYRCRMQLMQTAWLCVSPNSERVCWRVL